MNSLLLPRYRTLVLVTLVTMIVALGCAAPQPPQTDVAARDEGFPVLTGDYLGQTPPGTEPELFAPGIVSTALRVRDIAMTPDGTELFWSVLLSPYVTIVTSKLENGRWTEPEVAPFATNPKHMHIEPFISHDGNKLYFISDRPREEGGEPADQDIWVLDRTEDGWGAPYNLGAPVNSETPEYFPSLTRDGTIYFTRESADGSSNEIYRSRLVDGEYAEPEMLGPEVNAGRARFNALVAPDESYMIVPIVGLEDSLGGADYYVCFRNSDDTWLPPINMGDKVNWPSGAEWSPSLSPDGKYFFFMSSRTVPENAPAALSYGWLQESYSQPQNGNSDIYWMDASFIEQLRPQS